MRYSQTHFEQVPMEVVKSLFLKAALLPGMPEETAGAVPPQESEIAPEVL